MRLPALRRRSACLVPAAAVLLSGALAAYAQQPAAAPATSAAPAAAPASKKAPAKAAPEQAAASQKETVSYSLGVLMGSQLRDSGVAPDAVDSARIVAGLRDALSGKRDMNEADQKNMMMLVRDSRESLIERNHSAAAKFLADNAKKPGIVTTASGLQYKVLAAGSGDSPKPTDSVTVNYRGTLMNGSEFDSSYKNGEAATFGVSQVIPGWTEALQLMKPGGKMKLYIPPQLAYDTRSRPPIPPGSLLIFDVELVGIKPAAAPAAPGAAQPAPAPQGK